MIKLCQLRRSPTGQQASSVLASPKLVQLRMDQSAYLRSTFPASRQQQQLVRSNGVLMLPATQQPARNGLLALRARLSPAASLFNRLDGFVLQLETSRDFFARWPDQICQRIVRSSGQTAAASDNNNNNNNKQSNAANQQQPAAIEEATRQQNASSSICWTGQNYGSYTKKLVEFGKTNMQDHPEVPITAPTRVNEMILNFIDRFKVINDQLIRQSKKSPLTIRSRIPATGTKSTTDLRHTISDSSNRAPLRPEARVSATSQAPSGGGGAGSETANQQQQQAGRQMIVDLNSAMQLASSMPFSMGGDEAETGHETTGSGGASTSDEPDADESNMDESGVVPAGDGSGAQTDDSTPSDEDEEEEANEGTDPCNKDNFNDCNFDTGNNGAGGSVSNSVTITDDMLDFLQSSNRPALPVETNHQTNQYPGGHSTVVMTSRHHNQGGRFPSSYPMPTVSWEPTDSGVIYSSKTYDDSFGRQSSSSGGTSAQQLLAINLFSVAMLLFILSAWIFRRIRPEIMLVAP